MVTTCAGSSSSSAVARCTAIRSAVRVVTANLAIHLWHALLDPRVRVE